MDRRWSRKVGQELGVDAMALYRHVRSNDDLFDGFIELIVGEIGRPAGTTTVAGTVSCGHRST